MSRKTELVLVTALLLLAALLRLWDLSHLPPGFNRDELAHIRITEAMKAGEVSVYYQIGDRLTRAALQRQLLLAGLCFKSFPDLLPALVIFFMDRLLLHLYFLLQLHLRPD